MYFKCQKAVWSTSTWWVFLRTFQNTAIRNALMKLPLSWSPRAKKLHLRIPDRNQDRGEQTAQQDLSPAASLMWDRLLWASSWRRMESQKPWELLSACQSHSHPCASLKPENSASQLLCEVGNYSLPWQKWGVRRWHCSPGVPQEVWGKAEDEFNLPLSPLCLRAFDTTFISASCEQPGQQTVTKWFHPPVLSVWTLQTGSNCTDLLPSSEITLPRAVYKRDKAQLQSSDLNLLYRLEPTSICLLPSFHQAGNTIKTTSTKEKSINKNFYY